MVTTTHSLIVHCVEKDGTKRQSIFTETSTISQLVDYWMNAVEQEYKIHVSIGRTQTYDESEE